MDSRFKNVRVLVWDFDGTLYKQQQVLWDQIRESEYRVIMDHMQWTHAQAVDAFQKVHNIQTPSGTQSVAIITGISMKEAAIETTKYVDYSQYLKPDEKLKTMFDQLRNFRHFMLVNGTQESVTKGLLLLGIDKSIFEKIVTSEIVGETKPSQKGFAHILSKTGLPANAHLMIGDRPDVDLAPAKLMGFNTALVWKDVPDENADVTLSSIYEIVDVVA